LKAGACCGMRRVSNCLTLHFQGHCTVPPQEMARPLDVSWVQSLTLRTHKHAKYAKMPMMA
jgi:hypothetical protein